MTQAITPFMRIDAGRVLQDMAHLAGQAIAPPAPSGEPAAVSFSDSMKAAIRAVDAGERAASDKMAEVESGKSDDLVGAMLLSQEAGLSFSALVQVRNKVMGAVDDLIKMPL